MSGKKSNGRGFNFTTKEFNFTFRVDLLSIPGDFIDRLLGQSRDGNYFPGAGKYNEKIERNGGVRANADTYPRLHNAVKTTVETEAA